MKHLSSPAILKAHLSALKKRPSKNLSQNFLIDHNIIMKIVQLSQVEEGDTVLEIGPGPGALTQALLEKRASVIAVEKDDIFAKALPELDNQNLLQVINGDVLELDFGKILPSDKKVKVISNLPYNIASPILGKILPLHERIDDVIVMVQKEFAERMLGKPHTKAYSSLTLFIQMLATPNGSFDVSPNCFLPRPKVTSTVVSLSLHPPLMTDYEEFLEFFKLAFRHRRKMLSSSLPHEAPFIQSCLEELGLNPKARPENLSIEDFMKLYDLLFKEG